MAADVSLRNVPEGTRGKRTQLWIAASFPCFLLLGFLIGGDLNGRIYIVCYMKYV